MWSAQPSILTLVTIELDDYFKTNPVVKDLPRPGIEPQSSSPQPVDVAMSYNDPIIKMSNRQGQEALTCWDSIHFWIFSMIFHPTQNWYGSLRNHENIIDLQKQYISNENPYEIPFAIF